MDGEHPSIDLNHRILENEEIDLQVDASNSSQSTSQVDKNTAILIASDALSLSRKDQKRCITFAELADLEPVVLTSNKGKRYCLLGASKSINDLLVDQPVGSWELPLENSETNASSSAANENGALKYIIKTSLFHMHLSDIKYVELSKPLVNMISKDWMQFPQFRFAIPQFFSGAVRMDGSAALLLNGLEPYGRSRTDDAHFERRTKSTLYQSSFPRKENKYGPITIVATENDNICSLHKMKLVESEFVVRYH